MFSMGRFDPRMEAVVAEKKPKPQKKEKRAKHSKDKDLGNNELYVEMGQVHNDINEKGVDHGVNGYTSAGENSSSVPSSDASSSSAPSSDDESVEGGGDAEEPVLKVIAPEQKYSGIGTKRKRKNKSDEGMDDFDETQEEVSSQEQSAEVKTALKLSKLSIRDAAKMWNLAPFLIKNLEEDEYESFFPIQALVIPDVIASERHAHIRNRDICVSAPTGSGKTLAFVLPVLNSLAGRRVKRLRALVVLPSRDLGKAVLFIGYVSEYKCQLIHVFISFTQQRKFIMFSIGIVKVQIFR